MEEKKTKRFNCADFSNAYLKVSLNHIFISNVDADEGDIRKRGTFSFKCLCNVILIIKNE